MDLPGGPLRVNRGIGVFSGVEETASRISYDLLTTKELSHLSVSGVRLLIVVYAMFIVLSSSYGLVVCSQVSSVQL